ncbi:trimethylamine methyltransferase [Roseovarius faecimaris]|uniref:Methyltransferase n=1 Tax=Roseovarius faecimaris TaxID=2494550 RepID=A0A6I6INX9_9RHOB|nr:trimethylamine methyltransferase family protein [Roseovarius faecimaris]QGX98385.1 trimethylamine methyltransferase [Roseovarius faecimaris]
MARRHGGRQGRAEAGPPPAKDYSRLRHPFAPQRIFSDDEVTAIHQAALEVLQELGLKVLLPEARQILADAGARVSDEMVYFGRDMVEEALRTAPRSWRVNARNPDHSHVYEPGALFFSGSGGCPNASDAVRGRRPGDLESYTDALKLQQHFSVIHKFSPSAEPQDVPVPLRHYAMIRAQMATGDKALFGYARGRAQIEDTFEMVRLGMGLSDEEFLNNSWCSTVINTNSPRMIDAPMAQGIVDFARAGQMLIITPFCLAGAMAPITVAGALTLQHAESLGAITLAQMARPGAPVSYGGFGSNVDMKSGSPAFGTPEHVKMQLGSGQLARHIGLPWRSAAGSASNVADAQGATENMMGLWGGMMSGATLIVHSGGWLEGGLTFGYEKMITDLEGVQMIADLCAPTSGAEAEIGMDALRDVEPGGHFFATQHTMERYDQAFYSPLVADLSNFGSWEEAGAEDAATRATRVWQGILAEYTPPPGCDEAVARIEQFIADRSAAGGAPPME